MFQINQMQTTTLQKNLQKEKKIHKKILPLFLSHVLLLLFILATLFVHKKVREKRFLIANTQSMQTAKKLYFILGSRQRNTCVFTLVSSFTV